MSIRSKIENLITAANATTGETDATLTDAVQTLVDGYGGITPTGNINITDTNVTDVTQYATAQVVDADLVAGNIKEGVNILGIIGTFAGGGGLPSSISKIDGGSFTVASDVVCSQYEIAHNMGVPPMGFTIWTDELNEFAAQSKQYMMWVNTRIFTFDTNSTTTRYGLYGVCARQSSGTVYQNQSYHYDVESTVRWCNATRIKAHIGDQYFKAGITYKWIAWA